MKHCFKIITIILLLLSISFLVDGKSDRGGKERSIPVRNVIIMVPDGCSLSVLELTRLYYQAQGMQPVLSFDTVITGLSKTFTAVSPIGESAANITAMMTGKKSRAGYLGMDSDGNPVSSVFEKAKEKGIATGVVGTCEFPNATLTVSMVHTKNRNDYNSIIEQLVKNGPDVFFAGGGSQFINFEFNSSNAKRTSNKRNDNQNLEDTLIRHKGTKLFFGRRDFDAFPTEDFRKVWGLFNSSTFYLPYEFDRPDSIPSLAEMTKKAIDILRNNKNGFILLVEGSKIDWAAHINDPIGVISEFSAFDKAVATVLKFAREDKNTAVIISPDHGTGGISIGNDRTSTSPSPADRYDKMTFTTFGESFLKRKLITGEKLRDTLFFLKNTIESKNGGNDYQNWSPKEKQIINQAIYEIYGINIDSYDAVKLMGSLKDSIYSFAKLFAQIYTKQSYIGWTTNGHTGEDVFLAVYHPKGYVLKGVIDNTEIAYYIADLLDLKLKK